MPTKIKNMFATMLVLGILSAGAFWLLDPSKQGRERDHTMVTFKVTFSPSPRQESVNIAPKLNGVNMYVEPAKVSPWVTTEPVPRGSVVSLVALQRYEGGHLDCTIVINGQTYGPAVAGIKAGSSCTVSAQA